VRFAANFRAFFIMIACNANFPFSGMEQLFSGKGFKGMTSEDKERFLAALTGADGKVDKRAAAALVAAAASGGDPELAERIAERMMAGLAADDTLDPALMAALMATTSLAARGASNEEVLKAMQEELANSGLSKEEILAKTMLLQKAMAGDNSPAFVNKAIMNALNSAGLKPEELAKALLAEKMLAASGVAPEDVAKSLLVQKALIDAGLSAEDAANVLTDLVGEESVAEVNERLERELRRDADLSEEDVAKAISLAKALDSGKVRGLKNVINAVNNLQGLDKEKALEILKEAVDNGDLSKEALAQANAALRASAATGATTADLAKALGVQKALVEGGMSK